MGMQAIVIGRNRKTGKSEILADVSANYLEQKSAYEKHAETSDRFDRVGFYELVPIKRVFTPKPKAD